MKIQIDDIVRDATPEEEARILASQEEAAAQAQALVDAQAARESAIAKLSALGLTEAEINALIGGA